MGDLPTGGVVCAPSTHIECRNKTKAAKGALIVSLKNQTELKRQSPWENQFVCLPAPPAMSQREGVEIPHSNATIGNMSNEWEMTELLSFEGSVPVTEAHTTNFFPAHHTADQDSLAVNELARKVDTLLESGRQHGAQFLLMNDKISTLAGEAAKNNQLLHNVLTHTASLRAQIEGLRDETRLARSQITAASRDNAASRSRIAGLVDGNVALGAGIAVLQDHVANLQIENSSFHDQTTILSTL